MAEELGIIFQDRWLIACVKPVGVLAERGELRDLLYHDAGANKTCVIKRHRALVKEPYAPASRDRGGAAIRFHTSSDNAMELI